MNGKKIQSGLPILSSCLVGGVAKAGKSRSAGWGKARFLAVRSKCPEINYHIVSRVQGQLSRLFKLVTFAGRFYTR